MGMRFDLARACRDAERDRDASEREYDQHGRRRKSQITGLACPECGRALIVRTNRQDNTQFLGCSRYPACTYTQDELPESVRLRLSGAEMLPGFD